MIYFIGNKKENICKIGVSNNVDKRIKEIQCSCPFKVEVLITYAVSDDYLIEKALHNKYNENRLNGEWFNLSVIYEIDNGINENDLKPFLFDDNENMNVSEFSKKIINWHELSRHLSGNGQNIRPNKIPKKYQKKINRFLNIIDILFGS